MKNFLSELGVSKNQNLIVHSSFKKIKSAFPNATPQYVITAIQELIGSEGSLIMPSFTYCFKSRVDSYEIFDRLNTPSKVGALSEIFRTSKNVIRTSSPTHSFSMWGNITSQINYDNSPESPLGEGSVLDWLANNNHSYILMLGTHFDSLSFCHYLEVQAKVPWYDCFPWEYLGKEKIGVSIDGEQQLKEVPGCSKSFVNFESYLLDNNMISAKNKNELNSYFIPINVLLDSGLTFFKHSPEKLLCAYGTCQACDFRRNKFLS